MSDNMDWTFKGRIDLIDWATGICLLAALVMVYVMTREANFAAAFAWCMVGLVGLLALLRSLQLDMLMEHLRDLAVQAQHYRDEVVGKPRPIHDPDNPPQFLRSGGKPWTQL